MELNEYIEQKHDEHLTDLYELLRIPSVSAQSQHKPDIERAAQWVAERLRRAGLAHVEIVPTKMHPAGLRRIAATRRASPRCFSTAITTCSRPSRWNCGPRRRSSPPIRGGNLFGRGTADDKGQVHIHIRALDALQQTAGKLPINIKVLIEGEEEVGSESLWDYVNNNKAKLKADALVVSDTSMLARGVPSITYGLRGLNYYEIEITGPAQDLHSGIFGGAVPNPLTILAELFAKLHDKNFRVAVPGFYDDVAAALQGRAQGAQRAAVQSEGVPQDGGRARRYAAKKVTPSWSSSGAGRRWSSTASGAATSAKAPRR